MGKCENISIESLCILLHWKYLYLIFVNFFISYDNFSNIQRDEVNNPTYSQDFKSVLKLNSQAVTVPKIGNVSRWKNVAVGLIFVLH